MIVGKKSCYFLIFNFTFFFLESENANPMPDRAGAAGFCRMLILFLLAVFGLIMDLHTNGTCGTGLCRSPSASEMNHPMRAN